VTVRTIWKYEIPILDLFSISLPIGNGGTEMSLDLSWYKRGELARRPIILKNASDIYAHGQNAATLLLVALAAGLFVLLVWGAK